MSILTVAIAGLGVVAGVVTTLAGAGGGVFLIVSLSLLVGPHVALAMTAPTLLIGNMHRIVLYRDRVDRRLAVPIAGGAVLGSLVGGAVAMNLPSSVIEGLFLAITAFAVARTCGAPAWSPPRALLAPAGAIVGGVAATAGGAGLLVSPLLLSAGLTGESYVATSAVIALATHAGRLAGYMSRGLFSREVLGYALVSTVAVVVGNAVGDRVRPIVAAPRRAALVEHGTLAVCALLAVLGLHG